MRKLLFVLFASLAIGVHAQYDTIGKYPYLYYYNWPEMGVWYGSVYCAETVDHGAGSYGTGTVCSYIRSWPFDEFALYQHSDTPLEIVGLAMAAGTGGPSNDSCSQVKTTLYDSAMNEIASFHGIFSHQMTTTDTSAHHFFFPGKLMRRGLGALFNVIDTNTVGDPSNYVYYRFFNKTSYTVTGDFYIGVSRDFCPGLYSPGLSVVYVSEKHNNIVYRPSGDSSHYPPTAARYRLPNGVWSELLWDTGIVPVLFAIVKWPCVALDSATVTIGPNGCLRADWERPRTQSAWTVRMVMPNGSEVTQIVDTNHWEYCGLSPNQSYTVYLQSQCDEMGGAHTWSGWSGAFNSVYSPAYSLAEAGWQEAAITLRPNPATDEVTVDAKGVEEVVTVSVTDMAGVEVMHREGVRLPLTVGTASLAAGTYMVRVVTPQGTAVQKLMVMRK